MPKSSITSRFGAAVRSVRFRLGLSQEELAERAELHRTYIAGIERGGRNLTLRSIDKLARALEVPIADLLCDPVETGITPHTERLGEILLAEDNPDDVELTLRAFRESRIANPVHIVRDGAEALEYLFGQCVETGRREVRRPQVILLDLNLPKVSGLEVLRQLKRDPETRRVPVIVLTVSRSGRDINECRRLGAATYIVKPVDFQNFSQATPQLSMKWALLGPVLVPGA
jgi:CheY-like chemotaxis protein/DNA-binding XRE family transcriptional regulator